ncbi:hypothetical protein BCR44DRAFT_45344 [Catenaria anguillulae PL171]|uniref:Uncharacterized protein n=1 Tax=Catenaria anguillulae PL171 TaxID=765915 RepID=A0A1Y2HB64_9FUNG|nr:hypothetical protein BCR44DRAFT_45344 [Catenaria anguillulae PL171]
MTLYYQPPSRRSTDSQFACAFACRLVAVMLWDTPSVIELKDNHIHFEGLVSEAKGRVILGNGGFAPHIAAPLSYALRLAMPSEWIGRVREHPTGDFDDEDQKEMYKDCVIACEVLAQVDILFVLRCVRVSRYWPLSVMRGAL